MKEKEAEAEAYADLYELSETVRKRLEEVEWTAQDVEKDITDRDAKLDKDIREISEKLKDLELEMQGLNSIIKRVVARLEDAVSLLMAVAKVDELERLKELVKSWEAESWITRKELEKRVCKLVGQ